MSRPFSPVIVVAAFNRPTSIRRILAYLLKGQYEQQAIQLIISIDYQDSAEHSEVVRIANSFVWEFGEKTVIEHPENLGLRNHILRCGDLSERFGSVIVLEDDLIVSPYFYKYTVETLSFYREDKRIGGISLYNHKRNFCVGLPFELIAEHSDVYFLQIASSWGQAWSYEQWKDFRDWYKDNQTITKTDKIPQNVQNWPETSWLKYYIKYLVDTDKYFVYPKHSYSSNFGDDGTHHSRADSTYQVPLSVDYPEMSRFISLDSSVNVYDSHFELLPSILKGLAPALQDLDLVIDMYGHKNLDIFIHEYAISSKPISNNAVKKSFGLSLKPLVMNAIFDIEGNTVHLAKRNEFNNENRQIPLDEKSWNYFYRNMNPRLLKEVIGSKVKRKLRRTFKLK